ncbi:hydroxyacylglutathione hydrolase [Pacificibacter sp. AS14]|uniref:hydroxyacylglutathione hydrolase n=1 Tax=Pacificibacter sp. AS14 TaxID=3135785 RepID=UPI00316D02F3
MTERVTLPVLQDNYAFLLHDEASESTALVDVADHAPILAELDKRGWTLTDIWITHHHWDHVDGLAPLLDSCASRGWAPRVVAARADMHRLPTDRITYQTHDGDTFVFGDIPVHVIDVPGHTVGHIAFHLPSISTLFTADSLMALGCGRLFEGTPAQMWDSLQKLRALPAQTTVCSGHEYAQSNAAFAITVDPNNAELKARIKDINTKRAQNLPTVPSTLQLEIDTNPFLRADNTALKAAIGMSGSTDLEAFTEIRTRKDRF